MTTTTKDSARQQGALCESLQGFIEKILVIDGHDHILPREKVLESGDVLCHLIVTSCLSGGVVDADPFLQTVPYDRSKSWQAMSRYLPTIRNTSAYRCLGAAVKLLYDLDRFPLDEKGYLDLREKMEETYRQEDWYYRALREKANIDAIIWANLDRASFPEQDSELFLPAANLDAFLCAHSRDARERLEQTHRVRLQDFGDFLSFLGETLGRMDEQGVPAVWLGFCRFRPLVVGASSSRQAAAVFQKPDSEITPQEAKLFQDFVIHFIADQCASYGIPLQIDTGSPGHTISVEYSDPCQLTSLAAAHTKTRLVFLHGGYPFARHLGAQAKTFYNIYVDGSALAAHSLSMMKEIVSEWVELIPVAKILLWGGNAQRIESAVGSLILTRRTLTEILAERVETGLFTEELAFDLAQKLLRDVPRRLYRTDEVRIRRKTSAEAQR